MFNLQSSIKKCLPDVLAVLLFAVLAFAYFFPADIEGRILYRHDASAGRGAGQEGIEYLERTGERTRWTNALFSGMPTYQMAPSYGSTNLLPKAADVYHLWLPENVWYVFAYLLGFYILLRAFDFRQHMAALGSILWAFSTYFLIIIACRRAHLEGVGIGLSATVDCRTGAGLSWEIPLGIVVDGCFHGP